MRLLGVIEHFWDGYDPIIREMARIIRPGGHLFVTFPWMNGFRRAKAMVGGYPTIKRQLDEPFYQFALSQSQVREDLERIGFEFIDRRFPDVPYGIIKDLGKFSAPIGILYRYRNKNKITKAMWFCFSSVLNVVFGRLFSHTVLLVMRKHNL